MLRRHDSEVIWWQDGKRLQLREDDGLRVVALDLAEVSADDLFVCHCY
jgi:hypothetical protein